ncbi:deleted in lung and esophageal cancer protein 1 isoform X1 [Pygocentrus nattereri]|uniref:Deleted in lung and esophageal cancer protein 1 n=1 Tax=Pygocentrus nattereri TaxID=42514 RepID=A0A3B4CP18_PYGNA|nr:deleted in lung and esophageal cancer protein 1 isoform X1 [Pygocentrus nattereri]
MQEECEKKSSTGIEPCMNRHKPASEKTQDISHLLASIFRDLYTTEVIGKDTVTSLTKSRRGGNSYHDKYVEELQQVHLEYSRRMRDADMLEKHIIQARLQASATEERAQAEILDEVGEAYHQLGLPPVKSTFIWCLDNELLKSNNLICPQDYRTEQVPLIKAPRGKSTPGFAQPTVSYSKRVCKEPQDDGYTVIALPELTAHSLLKGSEETLTLPSSQEASDTGSNASEKGSRVGKPSLLLKPSVQSQMEDRTALQKFRKCQNFLRNPHFQPPSDRCGGKSLIMSRKKVKSTAKGMKERKTYSWCSSPEAPVPVFVASPPVVLFTEYQAGQVYETTVELRNTTAASRHVRVIPPTTPHFSVGLGRFPGDGGVVAPGMSCQYTVRFAPDSLADYEDFLLVETQSPYPLIVPLEARRPPPILTLPAVLDFGCCLAGGVKFMEVLCRNDGQSPGTFCIMPKTQWPASSLRSAVKASFTEHPPFAVSPSLFALLPGQAVVMEVIFFPAAAEVCAQSFTVVCDNCHVKDFTIQGTGQLVMLELVAVEGGEDFPELGELHDLTADHFVRFDPVNLNSISQKKLIIKNNAHLELPFHWQIMKPNLQALLPGETADPSCIQHHIATDNGFSISPSSGLLGPAQEHVFLLTYQPQELKDYHSVCHLVIRDVPDMQKINEDSSASQQFDMLPKVGDAIVMEIEVKGSAEPYKILLEPYALLIPGETYIHTTIHKRFKMWNHSKSAICFEWERISDCHIIEVEPSSGEIEMNECFDMDLILTGGRPGHFTTTLQCLVKHHNSPVGLPIEATFKGPQLTLSMPSLDLGLLELGQEICSTVQISNSSPLEANWGLVELPIGPGVSLGQVKTEPSEGVLPPLASCNVDVYFRGVCCQSFESVLQLNVPNGTGCHLYVRAEVQSPQVCLLSCELLLTDLYVGVAQSGKATLFNQTLLPAHFKWSKLEGPQAHLCSASFTPSSGTVEPNTQMEISVSFTTHTDEELAEVVAVCEVEGMEEPLVLGFFGKAKCLSVSYCLPNTDCASSDVFDQRPVILDFTGDDAVLMGKSATRQLMVTNHTAIAAPFTIEAEVFTGCKSVKKSQCRGAVKMPLHAVQAKKIEEKEYEEFVAGLLAHGKGAAFFVEPESGTLGPFESATINITAFSNMWGEYEDHLICKVGELDPTLVPMKLSVEGCPIHFQMIGPQPDNQNQGPIIRFGTHVSGGDTVSRSLRLNNSSPYNIRMDWLTYNKETGDRKLIDLIVAYGEPFPLKDADGNEVVGGLDSSVVFPPPWCQSHSPSTDRASSSLRTKSGSSEFVEETCDEEEREALARKLFSVFIQPHEGNAADYPYCITPQQIVVPAGGSSTIHVSFTPLTLSDQTSDHTCVGYALGYMSLDSKGLQDKVTRAQGYELKPLRLDLQAFVKSAILMVQMEDDEDTLEFSAAASDLLSGDTLIQEYLVVRTLQLSNSTDMPLGFRLSVPQPFSVLRPGCQHHRTASSHTPSLIHGQPVSTESRPARLLQPKHSMQVKVAFHLTASLLTCPSQPCEEVPPSVMELRSERGEKRLRFEQSLTIQYSNNTVQTIPLCAHLSLPTLHLSCDSIDFGTCFVGQTRVKEVHIYNHGGSSSYWTAFMEAEEQSEVFRVSPECGLLKPLEYPVSSCRQTLEISFMASDQSSFQGIVTVQGILGEPPLALQVQGRGSFDERYVSMTPDS